MFESATLKLTGYYLAIIMVICAGFSVTIYHFANHELRFGLNSQSQRLTDQYPGFNFQPVLHPQRDYNEGSHHILFNLIYFNLIVLILAGFASYGLARRTLRPIQQSHEQQKRFTADVSHELRTPLTALKMASEVALLDKSAAKSELRETLQSNLEEAGKLELLINNLLRLSRLEAAELQQTFTDVPVASLIDSALATVTQMAAKRHINLKTDVTQDLSVRGDHDNLVQLLGILLDNAVKYSPDKSTVQVSGEQEQDKVLIRITDSGMGIDSQALPHIFERFYRADAARTRNDSTGFGLGLSIAKTIADLHAGTIHITSGKQGTTVQISLPSDAKI